MRVTLVGAGPGAPELLTRAAQEAIGGADLLLGAPRLLEPFRDGGIPCREGILARDLLSALRKEAPGKAVVLLSGDTGFYSGAKSLLALLADAGIEAECLPGISSLQYLCARLCRPWEDVFSASAHGRACDPVSLLRERRTVFFLTGEKAGQTPGDLCRVLADRGFGEAKAWVGSRLSYAGESVTAGTAGSLAGQGFPSPSVLLVEREDLSSPWPYATGIPDREFLRGEGIPMTKEEVRAAALQKLRIAPGDILWDVGAGTGSVTVEMARLACRGRVFAVERLSAACALVRRNAQKFAVDRGVTLVEGEAPAALEALPPPDGVFLGGSGGSLRPILELVLKKNPRARVVVPAVTLETLGEAAALFRELPLGETSVTQVSVARAIVAGSSRLMKGQNPVFLFAGTGLGEEEP